MRDSEAIFYSSSSSDLPHSTPTARSRSASEGHYPLPGHRSRHSGSVEFLEMIRRVIVDADYHVWPEPPFRELARRHMLVVEVAVVN